ncbi:MAG: hypothetical protein ACI9MR_002000 [Myxococcota bacterium]|jgi:hypothetical protein
MKTTLACLVALFLVSAAAACDSDDAADAADVSDAVGTADVSDAVGTADVSDAVGTADVSDAVGTADTGNAAVFPPTVQLQVDLAPDAVPAFGNVCYDAKLTNGPAGTGDVLWTKGTPGWNGGTADGDALCTAQWSGGGTGVSYERLGGCDFDGQEDADPEPERTNSVTVWFDALYDDAGNYVDPSSVQGWQDPCGTAGCTIDILCQEGFDVLVKFDSSNFP